MFLYYLDCDPLIECLALIKLFGLESLEEFVSFVKVPLERGSVIFACAAKQDLDSLGYLCAILGEEALCQSGRGMGVVRSKVRRHHLKVLTDALDF